MIIEKSNDVNNPETSTAGVALAQTSVPQQSVDETFEQSLTESTSPQKSNKKLLQLGLICLVIVDLVITGYFVYQNLQLRKERLVLFSQLRYQLPPLLLNKNHLRQPMLKALKIPSGK